MGTYKKPRCPTLPLSQVAPVSPIKKNPVRHRRAYLVRVKTPKLAVSQYSWWVLYTKTHENTNFRVFFKINLSEYHQNETHIKLV
jgi:hypothetical protein